MGNFLKSKPVRESIHALEAAGIEVLEVNVTKRSHLQVTIATPKGPRKIFAPWSGDRKAHRNMVQNAKSICRGEKH